RVLPRKLFGYVHPKFRTPAFNVILVGAVSLLAISPSLELITSVINFGALIAFTFVNLSVIAHFVFRKKRYKTAGDLFSYLIMPLIGAALTGILWYYLHADALIGGLVWVAVGFVYMLFLTKFFRTKLADIDFEEADQSA
ncbi:MAG TPA: Putrescine importer PuuP, partial [Bacillales bacterium]|nr:Putrescine importer PuuP [Bacillales bacterium]